LREEREWKRMERCGKKRIKGLLERAAEVDAKAYSSQKSSLADTAFSKETFYAAQA
jgi:predicted metalloprotease